jgi:gluconate kinase
MGMKAPQMKKKVIILYGEMGSGKNYQGERLAKSLGFEFFDGDLALPAYLVERTRNFKPLTPEMVNDFVYIDLLFAISGKVRRSKGIVVAQALYLREARDLLGTQLKAAGFDVEFRLVKVPFLQNLRQLLSRPRGNLWVLYWLANKPFFQP